MGCCDDEGVKVVGVVYENQNFKEEKMMAFDFAIWFANMLSLGGFLMLLGIVGFILVIRGQEVKFGKLKWIAGFIFIVLSVVGLNMIGTFQMLGFGGALAVVPQAVIPSSQIGTPSSPQDLTQPVSDLQAQVCTVCDKQSDGTNGLDTVIRNAENSSQLGYLAGSIAAELNGITQDTSTSTAGVALSYTSLNVPPCKAGTIYVLGTNGVGTASGRIAYQSCETVSKYEIQGAGQDVLAIQAYDNQLNAKSNGNVNGSGDGTTYNGYFVSGASTTDGNAYYQNTTLSTGGSIKGFLGLDVNGTTTVFGNYGTTVIGADGTPKNQLATDGIMISYNSVDASIFSDVDYTLSQVDNVGLSEVPCPNSVRANRDAERCWSMRTLKDTDGEVQLKFQLKASLGNPTETGDAPKVCFDDKVYFRGADGNIKYDFFNAGGTNQGVAGICLTYVMA